MVDVTTTVELDSLLKLNLGKNVVGFLSSSELLEGGVKTVDVGLVVLGVVEGHDLLRDVGLQLLSSEI